MSEQYNISNDHYEPYTPGELDEDGNSPAINWEQKRDKDVRRQIKSKRSRRSRANPGQPRTYGRVAVLPTGFKVDDHLIRTIRRGYDPEFRRRERLKDRLMICSLTAIGAAAISGVIVTSIQDTHNSPSEDLAPIERFNFDYNEPGYGAADCFTDTAYDLKAGGQGEMSVTQPSSSYISELDLLTITPVSGASPLHLTGFEQYDHTLTPVGHSDEAIFSSYGCNVEEY